MRRVISLWLPRFATDRLRLRQQADRAGAAAPFPLPPPARGGGIAPPSPSPCGRGQGRGGAAGHRPLVTTIALGGRSLVAAVDQRAAAAGVTPGMPLADARALAPELATRLADPAGDAAALARLADWCRRHTPLTAVEGAGDAGGTGAGLWLDITGCAHLFGGEAALLAELTGRLRRFGYDACAGLADTPGAAWAAARFLPAARDDGAAVAPGMARTALAPLPVAALRLAPAAAEGLARLGLRRIGDLYPLPRATLARRFGDAVGGRLDQALGRLPEPISPRQPSEPHLARLVLAEPVTHAEGLAAGLEHLLARLCRDLDTAQLGARRLVLVLYRVDGSLRRTAIGTSQPNRDPAALARLFAGHLDRLDPGFGVEVMTLEAVTAEPLTALQLVMRREASPANITHVMRGLDPRIHSSACAIGEMDRRVKPGDDKEGGVPSQTSSRAADASLADLIDRLGNRLGFDRVTRLVPRESHLPERAVVRQPVAKPASRARWQDMPPRIRPPRLLAPAEPVQATALLPDYPPAMFRRGPVLHRIARATGPERLLPEWWHATTPEAALPPARDYFRVEDEAGRRYWLYREGAAGARPARWFLHGLFG